jgi:hypothetical protein
MIEVQERALKASLVRTGDRLVLSDRLVTMVTTSGRSVFLHDPLGHTVADADALVRVLRRVRVEPPDEAPPVDGSHVWFVRGGSRAGH